jgi:DNA-binding IclR family transcriptional regulator
MTESEILIPVRCPICSQEPLTGFRVSVIAEALQTLEMRLYAECHLTSWEASELELAQIREYVFAESNEDLEEAC